MTEPSRNSPCPCGSGNKFKHCCMGKPAPSVERKKIRRISGGICLVSVIFALSTGYYWGWETSAVIAVLGLMLGGGIALFVKPPPSTKDRSSSGSIDFGR